VGNVVDLEVDERLRGTVLPVEVDEDFAGITEGIADMTRCMATP
jgi:hypothetical protein